MFNHILRYSALTFLLAVLTACGSSSKNSQETIAVPSSIASSAAASSIVSVASLYQLSPMNMPIGVAIPVSVLSNTAEKNLVKKHFNQITAENIMKPSFLQPEQGSFFFDEADSMVLFAIENGIKVHGHTLVWHNQLPAWMNSFSGTKSEWVAMMENHVTQVALHFYSKFGSGITSWDVVNEAFEDAGGSYRNDIWYNNIGPEYIEKAFIAARAADPNADLYYNDYNIEWNDAKLDAVIAMVKDFRARGIPINGVGFQAHIWASQSIPKLKAQFAKVVAIDPSIKVKISEMDVRFNYLASPIANPDLSAIYSQHKQIIHDLVQAYLDAVPEAQRGGITSWGIADGQSWILGLYGRSDWPLLFLDSLETKPAVHGFADALQGK